MAAEMAQKPQISEAMFRELIRFSLGKLGQPELELKQEQLEAIKAICAILSYKLLLMLSFRPIKSCAEMDYPRGSCFTPARD